MRRQNPAVVEFDPRPLTEEYVYCLCCEGYFHMDRITFSPFVRWPTCHRCADSEHGCV